MKGFVLALLTFCAIGVSAQVVKKVQIRELEDYIKSSDHPLVVSFWATWCAPCIEEIPYLQDEIKKYDKVEFVLVSLDFRDSYPATLTSFIKKKNFQATFYWLNETNADMFCPKIDPKWDGSIPATLLVNNASSYRKFFDRQLTQPQVVQELRLLTK